jgi:hypothetical protein
MSTNDRRDGASGNPKDGGKSPQQPRQSSGGQQQAGSGEGKQYGEGNYKATRDYNRGVKEHMQTHDVEREARDAAPRSEEEARQMQEAEREGRGKARGAGASGHDDANDPPTGKG